MATIRIDAGKVNKMHGLINDVKKSAADYKSELEGVKKQVLAINRSVCDLDGVLDELRISSDLQDAKMEFCDALTNDIDGFVEEAVRIDREVAARISRRADEFYEEYPWLRPDCRKSGWERFINSFKEAEEWCLDRWKETGLAARRQMAAVLAAVNQGPGQGVTGMAVALPYLVSQFLAEHTADAAAWAVKLYQEKKTVRTGVNAAGATYLAVTAPVFAGVLATAGAAALAAFALTNGKKKEEEVPLYILPEPTPTPTPGKGYDPEYEARIAEMIPWELGENTPATGMEKWPLRSVWVKPEGGAVTSGNGDKGDIKAGEKVDFEKTTRLDKADITRKDSWQYAILQSDRVYTDAYNLCRFRKGEEPDSKTDLYCVALPPAVRTLARELDDGEQEGHAYRVTMTDKDGKTYGIDVLMTDVKDAGDVEDDMYPHTSILEFFKDGKLDGAVTVGGNVSPGKLLSEREGERIRDLVITEISVYEGSAVVEKVDNQFRMKP